MPIELTEDEQEALHYLQNTISVFRAFTDNREVQAKAAVGLSMLSKLQQAYELVQKLPRTRDGVLVYPGMEVWWTSGENEWYFRVRDIILVGEKIRLYDSRDEWIALEYAYSTEQAAREGRQGQCS